MAYTRWCTHVRDTIWQVDVVEGLNPLSDSQVIGTSTRMEAVWVKGAPSPLWRPPAMILCTAYHEDKSQPHDHLDAIGAMLWLIWTGQVNGFTAVVGCADYCRRCRRCMSGC